MSRRLIWACGLGLLLAQLGCEEPREKPPEGEPEPQVDVKIPAVAKPAPNDETPIPLDVRRADYAITKLMLGQAETLLAGEVGPDASRARARLAIYRADCEGALSHLASTAAKKAQGAEVLLDLAERCTGATAGAIVVENEEAGVWLRLQDRADRVLVPLLTDVAERAREALERDLGVTLPRPLRIDLVRDLFSLSAVSGLRLEAAETTGTVAVARWGRVTMVSPRAMRRGFPWADTLAHEITHLLLSRGTADRAPLWLQEGIAKREERLWREEQAFDGVPNFAKKAFEAEREGKAVGVDSIGPSIAMLPSAEAASIAFAEVKAYMDFWIEQNGPHALSLLLRELEIAPDADSAMRGVSGYDVSEWQLLWREHLAKRFSLPKLTEETEVSERLGPRALSRALRLTELLTVEGFFPQAAELAAPELDRASHSAALRFMASRAALLAARDDAELLLGDLSQIERPHAGWLALRAGYLSRSASSSVAQRYLTQALSLDPLLPEAACGGQPWVGKATTSEQNVSKAELGVVGDLCEHTKNLVVRGSR